MDDTLRIRSLLSSGKLDTALTLASTLSDEFTKLSFLVHINNTYKAHEVERKHLVDLKKLAINGSPTENLVYNILYTQYIYREYDQKETEIQIIKTEKLYVDFAEDLKENIQYWYKTFLKIKAYYYHISSRFDLALEFYLEYKLISEKLKQVDSICNAYLGIGEVYAEQGDFDKALENYNKALVLSKEIENYNEAGFALLYSGKVNEILGHYDQALNNFESAIDSFRNSNLQQFVIIGFLNLGHIQQQTGEIDKAIYNFNRVIDYDSHEYSLMHIADAYYYLGIANLSKNEFQKALIAFNKNIEICIQTNNYIKESLTLFRMIIGCIQFDQVDQISTFYDRMKVIAKASSNKIIILRTKLVKGIILQQSARIAKIVEANEIFNSIINDPTVKEFIIKKDATISLCNGLILELKLTNSKEALDEINESLDWILNFSRKQKLIILEIEGLLIKSKLFLVQLKIEEALQIIDEALNLTEKTGVIRITEDIKIHKKIIINQINKYRQVSNDNKDLYVKLEETQLNAYLEDLRKFLSNI